MRLPLFDTLHSERAIVLEETRDDEIDVDRLATRLLENDGDIWLLIGLTEGATAVLTYNRLMNSIIRTPIERDPLDGNGRRQIDRRRTDGHVLESVQQLRREYFDWFIRAIGRYSIQNIQSDEGAKRG